MTMIYAERAYFDGDHCAHIAARDDYLRLRRIDNICRDAWARVDAAKPAQREKIVERVF